MDLVQEPVQEKFQLAEQIQQLLTSNGDKAAAGPSLVRVTVDIRPTDPLTWLAVQPYLYVTYDIMTSEDGQEFYRAYVGL